MRRGSLALGTLTASIAAPATAQMGGFTNSPPDDREQEVTRMAVGGGTNLTGATPGWQATVAVMGENREKALLTQIGLSLESIAAGTVGPNGPEGRLLQVVLNPATIYAGWGAFRVGGGFDLSWGFAPEGNGADKATGLGWGARAGGGLALHPGGINLWLLGHYRWVTGDRPGGWFFDLMVGPD